jgi:putative ABC transport system ATP-binding protein
MTSVQPLLEVAGLGRRRPDADGWLLQDISLSVHGGDRIALTGPTGSGKTLLLRALALLDPFDATKFCWRGEPIIPSAVPAYRASVMYLHQRPALIEGTVEDNLRLPYSLNVWENHSFDGVKAARLLKEADQGENFLLRSDQNLSGGERQIVAIVRALQLEPTILLLDEPTASLDASSAAAIERLVDLWYANDRAFLWVSHSSAQAERVATKTVRLQNGRMS